MPITRRRFIEGVASLAVMAGTRPVMSAPPAPSKADIRTVGQNKILFMDFAYVEKSARVRLKVHPPRKTGERIIESDHPWEDATLNWFSVLQDGDKYRMWYECYDVDGWPTGDDTSFCYAESTDGVHWTKPKLGLHPYRGSHDTNILFRQIGDGKHRSRVHGSGVFLDPSAPADARYKCVSQGQFQGIAERPYFIAGMTSADGLKWTRHPQPICQVFADSQYSGFWDEHLKEYVLYGRVSGRGGRALGRSASKRFDQFEPLVRVLEMEESHPKGADLYNPACVQYPGVQGCYLMFPSLFRHKEDTLDIRLAVSRDGINWTWPNHETPFIPLGDPGEFDSGSLYMANGSCLTIGNELSFYFSGSRLKHEETSLENLKEPKNRRVFSRAVAPLDRLVSMSADAAGGELTTHALQVAGNRLLLNAAVRPNGSVKVGLLNADGTSIAGRGIEECQALKADKQSWAVSWANAADVAEWSTKPIRLHIEFRSADVFGFQFVAMR